MIADPCPRCQGFVKVYPDGDRSCLICGWYQQPAEPLQLIGPGRAPRSARTPRGPRTPGAGIAHRAAVLAALREGPLTLREVRDRLQITQDTTRAALAVLYERGEIERVPAGGRTTAWLYQLPQEDRVAVG